jgi:hypothetical protein
MVQAMQNRKSYSKTNEVVCQPVRLVALAIWWAGVTHSGGSDALSHVMFYYVADPWWRIITEEPM